MSKDKIDPNNPLPLYYQVYASLREQINLGEIRAGEPLPPERQLAQDYGVSRITIIKALDKLEQDGLIERQQGRGTFVMDLLESEADENGPCSIGWVPGGLLHPYFYAVQMGIADVVRRERCFLHVIGAFDERSHKKDNLFDIITRSVEGVIVYPRPNKRDLHLYERLLDADIPLVMVDRYYEQIESDYVVFDEEKASFDLTSLLIDRGHKRIAILPHFEVNVSSIRNRISGYRRALKHHAIDVSDDLIWLDVYSNLRPAIGQKGDERMTAQLLAYLEQHGATALIAINHDVAERLTYDMMMLNNQRAQEAINRNSTTEFEIAPEIVTFGHKAPEDYGPYNIATALQPGEALGQQAAEILIKRLNGTLIDAPQAVRIPVEIVVRET